MFAWPAVPLFSRLELPTGGAVGCIRRLLTRSLEQARSKLAAEKLAQVGTALCMSYCAAFQPSETPRGCTSQYEPSLSGV